MEIRKDLNGRKVNTTYAITEKGDKNFWSFRQYILGILS
ncbi:MAG: hypothetical protein JO297_07555 [Nitrososphaeraceae archaeon]|nr:hypothetical protein [Nitrososphaeraceae archaeon]